MKRVLLSLTVLLFVSGFGHSSLGGTKVRILPFKVWKQKKIDEAKAVVAELKHQNKKLSQIKSDSQEDDEKQDTAQQLSQAELNLGVVRELSANDYFLLYVSPQFKSNNEAFVQAAKALTPRDMADILAAYQRHLQPVDISGGEAMEHGEPGDEAGIQEKTAKSP